MGVLLGLSLFLGFGVGPLGEWMETGVRLLVGQAVALAPLVLVVVGIATILAHPLMAARPLRLGLIIGGEALLIALAAGLMGLGTAERAGWFDARTMEGRGGILGESGYWITGHLVGSIGTALIVVVGLIAAALLITGASLGHLLRRGGQGAAVASRNVGRGVATATASAVRTGQRVRERFEGGDVPELPTLVDAGARRAPPRRPRRRSTAPTRGPTCSASPADCRPRPRWPPTATAWSRPASRTRTCRTASRWPAPWRPAAR